MALITNNNTEYNAGHIIREVLDTDTISITIPWAFEPEMYVATSDSSDINYSQNNFVVYSTTDGVNWTEFTLWTVSGSNIITPLQIGITAFAVQLKSLTGGSFGNRTAYGTDLEDNYGNYAYIELDDIIDNFMVAYVGNGKLIQRCNRADAIFHAKRGMQEFSYDTLKAIKSEELTVPPHLAIALPQDYVNYVKVSRIDSYGAKHPLLPSNRLTHNPGSSPLQDENGQRVQDYWNENIEGDSITEQRYSETDQKLSQGNSAFDTAANQGYNIYGGGGGMMYQGHGQRFGGAPERMNVNGYYSINDRTGQINFSADLAGVIIVFEYISDGLAFEEDIKIPKLAEQAMYMHMLHAILSTRANVPEYVINRYKKERRAALRNAKIRLSNIKLEEITQVLRNQSKWIKH